MILLLGYLVAFIGFFIGYICTLILIRENTTITAFLLGITGGLLISFSSFELIPLAINNGNLWSVLFFMTVTLIAIVILDNKYNLQSFNTYKDSFFKTSIILGFGIGVHNFPEGFALGSLYVGDFDSFKSFMIVIIVHCIPESMALCIFLIKSNFKHKDILFIISILSLPMGIGTYIGHNLFKTFQFTLPISLSIASATMIYVASSEILPTTKLMDKRYISIIGSFLGIIIGITLVTIF